MSAVDFELLTTEAPETTARDIAELNQRAADQNGIMWAQKQAQLFKQESAKHGYSRSTEDLQVKYVSAFGSRSKNNTKHETALLIGLCAITGFIAWKLVFGDGK